MSEKSKKKMDKQGFPTKSYDKQICNIIELRIDGGKISNSVWEATTNIIPVLILLNPLLNEIIMIDILLLFLSNARITRIIK